MRIKQISVTGLFGMFDHVIPLNMEDRITIIYGLNGVGKTAILRLLNGFFNLRYSEVRSIPFKDFQINFDDDSYLKVSKTLETSDQIIIPGSNINVFFKDNIGNKYSHPLKKLKKREDMSALDIQEENLLPASFPKKGKLAAIALSGRLDNSSKQNELENMPAWLKNIKDSISIRFIESQRLLTLTKNNSSKLENSQPLMTLSVSKYATELAKNIQKKLAEYGTLSQSLDRSFPNRVLQHQEIVKMPDENLINKLSELERKRQELINAGFLDKEENSDFQIPEKIDDSTNKLLSVYVEDVEKKLSVFDDLAQRIELFKRIINQRFSYKQINISKDKGFTFTSNGHTLSPDKLSSGEQHELIILYELLFKVQPNSLILIDEPEISLHVEWQVYFLKDLQKITQIAGIDVLIATHSPDIINGQWDLTVELKETRK